MKKRARMGWLDSLKAVVALGLLAWFYLWLIQVLVVGVSVGIGLVCALFQGWQAGLFAGVVAYAVIMKLMWYGDIWSMITAGGGGEEGKGAGESAGEGKDEGI